MQLPLTPPVVLAALLVTGATTEAPHTIADVSTDPVASTQDVSTQDVSIQDVADVPADAPVADDLHAAVTIGIPLPRDGACPAYLGPQCDSVRHEQYATGQQIAALGLTGI
jgi:hypothetical protein